MPIIAELEIDEIVDNEELDVEIRAESLYSSNLFPAPQYSRLFPGHLKLQSLIPSGTDPALMELPQ